MKIVMVTQFFPPRIGGVERHVSRVSRALAEGGDDVHVVTWKYDDDLPGSEEIEGVKVHRILGKSWYRGNLRRCRGWAEMGRARGIWGDADVIHFHDYTPLIEWFLPYALIRRGIFITFHGYEGYPVPRLSIALRRLSAFLTRGSICAGAFIPRYYGTRARFITYGGVDAPSSAHGCEREGAVYVGGLRHDLGIRGYVETLAILRENHGIELHLDLVGDGPLRREIEAAAKERNVDVRLHGFQTDTARYLARARVAMVDSYLVLLEAMAWKTPVFSYFDNPLKRDYLDSFPGRFGIIAVRDTPVDLAGDLADFLSRPDAFRDRVESGYEFAIEQTWERVADLYRKLYAGD